MSLSVFFLPMARVGAAVTMRLMVRCSAGMMQTDNTHCIHSIPDCVWRLVPSVTRFRAFRCVPSCLPLRASVPSDTCPRVFRYAPSCLPIRASRRHFHAAICYFLIRDCHLHVSNPNLHVSNHHLHVSKCHLHVSNHYLHVIGGHLRVVQPYDNQCGRFLLGLDGNGERH